MPTRNTAAPFCLLLMGTVGLAADPAPKADPAPTAAKAMEEARVRWNKLAAGVTVKGSVGAPVGFEWGPDHFPHPTFKGGSAEAYGAFARLLARYLGEKGNFEYLAENNLLSAPLRYGKLQVDWTFAKLATDLSGPKGFGDHDEATRATLKGFADQIAKRTGKDRP